MIKFKTITVAATSDEALAVLEVIQDKYGVRDEYGPWLQLDAEDDFPRIIWEGGPFDWDIDVSCNLPDSLPDNVWLEPINCYSLRVFKDVPNPDF